MKKAYSLREVVDFIPASLHETKNWEIIFYARDPQSGDLRRKRIRVGGIKNKVERRIWAKQMIYSINKRLNDGWNPFIEAESSRQFHKIEDVITAFLRDKRGLRKDTLRTYQSEIDFLMKFIRENYQPDGIITTKVFSFSITIMIQHMSQGFYLKIIRRILLVYIIIMNLIIYQHLVTPN
ncbi:MAG: hypothetical protein ABFS05_04070 [Bacteroidota bacterium]